MTFEGLGLSPPLLQAVKELGFDQLTPIQAAAIPVLLGGTDLIGQSQTGSGKTAAFGLPLLQRVSTETRALQALVVCPTRELGAQVAKTLRQLARRMAGVQVLELAGGQVIAPQVSALEKGAHVAVGTPGRLLDLLRRGALDASAIRTVVLDEADRMLDMGFIDDMTTLLAEMPSDRQTALFSATFPPDITKLSERFQRAPTRVTIDTQAQQAPDIRQSWVAASVEEKPAALLSVLRELEPASAIVFCNFKATVNEVVSFLLASNVGAAALQGDLEQRDRDRVMATFRNQSTRVLVATDVAARGLDVDGLDAVFNFELPQQSEIYVHRIGRTARAGHVGAAYALCTEREQTKLPGLERLTGATIERHELKPELELAGRSLEARMATLRIDAGRKDKMRPGDILGALTGDAGLSGADVGKIEIHDHHAYVAVSRGLARTALERLRQGRIKGKKHRIDPVR